MVQIVLDCTFYLPVQTSLNRQDGGKASPVFIFVCVFLMYVEVQIKGFLISSF